MPRYTAGHRLTFSNPSFSGPEYEQRLRQQHAKLNQRTSWAKPADEQKPKKKKQGNAPDGLQVVEWSDDEDWEG